MTTEGPARPGRIDQEMLRRKYAEERDKRRLVRRPLVPYQSVGLLRWVEVPVMPRPDRAGVTCLRW